MVFKAAVKIICVAFTLFLAGGIKAQQATSSGVTVATIDPRVKLHYSELDLNKIALVAPYKLEQLQFQYTASFVIKNTKGNAIQYDASKFDVHNYERFRKDNERVSFNLTRNGDTVELLSRNELQLIYNGIKEKY